jgi:predicted Zn-dependent peptidase
MSPRPRLRVLPVLALLALACGLAPGLAQELSIETYTLPNGLSVTLHEDHRLPQVVINTWFAVGSKDEAPGRTGFAHLFEHLMFMGTERVPGNQFDVIMESGGGWNNASTSTDRTNYFSVGPPELLPTLLWLDADRLEALGENMTAEKLDLQREVVRNERRQQTENLPYGSAELLIPELLYPEGHPYHHPIIGSHEDLEAATLQDVKDFFARHYVTGNASLVVAGDFDAAAVREVIAATFGAVPGGPAPVHLSAPPVVLERERRHLAVDKVSFPRLYLIWHSPALYAEGDAEMDLLSSILAGGASTRLEKRLVIETGLAQEVQAYQYSKQLGSEFRIVATAAPGADLEAIKREILTVLEQLQEAGPTAGELGRVQAATESQFLRRMEGLLARANQMNAYRLHFGTADGFARDLARWSSATTQSVREQARRVFGEGRLDMRVLPEGAAVAGADLDRRPEPFPASPFRPPVPETFALSNGMPVHALSRPGTRLFAGVLLVPGGESLVPAEKAGLAPLVATMLTAGAGGRDASDFNEAVESLGGAIGADAGPLSLTVSVSGLTSRMGETLDLFADAVLRPNLAEEDFEREKGLALARIEARGENPQAVSRLVASLQLFGAESPFGRPAGGWAASLGTVAREDLEPWKARLLSPSRGRLVFVGDFEVEDLREALESRFGGWTAGDDAALPELPVLAAAPAGRLLMVDRPGAPQTVIRFLRPLAAPADDAERALRSCLDIALGGSFTSRLNQNLREEHGYSYGAGSRVLQNGPQHSMIMASSVQTEVTAAALGEFWEELEQMAAGTLSEEELAKARETARSNLVETAGTTGALTTTFAGLLSDGRPLDAVGRDLEALGAVDLASANELARSGLYDRERFLVVLVGDAETVLPRLREAGYPEPVLLDAEGAPVE